MPLPSPGDNHLTHWDWPSSDLKGIRMNESIIWAALGLLAGAAISWVLSRSRQRQALSEAAAAALEASTQLQVEVSILKERASRIPELEGLLATSVQTLNAANERKAKLESEILRLPELETRRALTADALEQVTAAAADLRTLSARQTAELSAERENLVSYRSRLEDLQRRFDSKSAEASALAIEVAQLRNTLEAERSVSQEKLALLLDAKQALTDQFKALANEILEEKSKRFTEQNQTNLGALLDPLRLKITEFQTKIEDNYVKEGRDRSALGEQVRQLMELNQHLSEDAKNLTRALRGSSKAQGTWGEWILEKVLEASGLRKGEEYVVQSSHTREDGSRALPDVILHLPEGRSLVIDSKVSLVAYEEFAVTENEAERAAAGKRHMESIRGHIKGLSGKNYQTLYSLNSLDFVLLFVPIEPAFMLAVATDRDLFMDAWNRNVLLVSPSTLLFVVRTVAHLWRQEAQSRNAQEIAKRAAELYDKFVGFVEDMNSLGNRLKQAQSDYDDAFGKLANGRGNLVGQAQKLRQLGVKPSKSLAPALVEGAYESDELPFALEEDAVTATDKNMNGRALGDLT
jgi:DNA recombination protein RmuC